MKRLSTLDATAVIEAERLRVGGARGFQLSVDELKVRAGEVIALVGANGAGKSTLLEALAGLIDPSSGTVRVAGFNIRHCAATHPLRRELGVQLATTTWNPSLKVKEILAIHRAVYGRCASDVLERLGMAELAESVYGQLSTGQSRRVAAALALAHEPRVLLLDEPSAALDARYAEALWACVMQRRAAGAAVVVASHSGREVEAADRVVWLRAGEVLAQEPPADLLHARLGQMAVTVHCADEDCATACETALAAAARHLEREGSWLTAFGEDTLRHEAVALAERYRAKALTLRCTDGDDLLALVSGRPLIRKAQ